MTAAHVGLEPPLVLALDVGTSSCRASLYDAQGRRLERGTSQTAYAPITTAEGGAELDADTLFDTVCRCIDAALANAGAASSAISAVGISTFWHSLLGLDAAQRPATPLYLWLDARSRAQADLLKERLDEREVHRRTGCVLHWSYLPAKLLWLSEVEPERFRASRLFLSFGEYLLLRLCGDLRAGISMASGSGLLNHHLNAWDPLLLSALPLELERLPRLEQRGEPPARLTPAFAQRWPALRAAPWLAAAGDGACSNLGAGCLTRERRAIMIGTSAALRVLWRTEDVEIPWGVWCYRAGPERFLLGGATNDGGSLIAWLREAFRLPALDQAEAAVAAMHPDSHGLTVLPYWGGERSPGWASDARGAVVGLRLHTSPEEILRAAMEAVALAFARIDRLLRSVVPETREIVATGGALLRSPAWLQIFADALGQPVRVSTEAEGSSRGAALLALEAVGALPHGIEGLPPPIGATFDPVPAHVERYRQAAERHEQLYRLLIAEPPLT